MGLAFLLGCVQLEGAGPEVGGLRLSPSDSPCGSGRRVITQCPFLLTAKWTPREDNFASPGV